MTARDIEVAVANHFNPRVNTIVPNVYWGMGLNHEADLLILSQAGYATEVEIKISKADLLRDSAKTHGHQSQIIKALWFAVPSEIKDVALISIPEEAGLLEVYSYKSVAMGKEWHRCRIVRAARPRKGSRKFDDHERRQLERLGLLRYWTLRIPEIAAPANKPAAEIARLKAELAEARETLRRIEQVQYWETREIARDFLAKHMEEP